VASIGGFVRQYQVNLDPNKLLAYGIPLSTVIDRVKSSTNEVGGRVLELSGTRYMVRGLGYLKSLDDLANVPVMAKNGTPVLIRDLGTVSFGPDIREGVAEWNGEGETVGGIVVMRYGLNALNVIDGVKKKLAEIKGSLPPGVEVVVGYDRGGLISESINTLKHSLLDDANGPVLHDEKDASAAKSTKKAIERERVRILIDAAKQVGPALFFSLLIIVVSFLPVFLLEAQEGRMFRPLAWTKTLAVGFS